MTLLALAIACSGPEGDLDRPQVVDSGTPDGGADTGEPVDTGEVVDPDALPRSNDCLEDRAGSCALMEAESWDRTQTAQFRQAVLAAEEPFELWVEQTLLLRATTAPYRANVTGLTALPDGSWVVALTGKFDHIEVDGARTDLDTGSDRNRAILRVSAGGEMTLVAAFPAWHSEFVRLHGRPDGTLWVYGPLMEPLTLGEIDLEAPAVTYNAFVAELTVMGEWAWARGLVNANTQVGADSDGFILGLQAFTYGAELELWLRGTLDLDGVLLTCPAQERCEHRIGLNTDGTWYPL